MNHDGLRFGNLDYMQIAWSEVTPGEVHASWSGHLTACGESVIKAKPVYDSRVRDITCAECGATAVFDLGTAREKAKAITEKYEATGSLSRADAVSLRETALQTIAPQAFKARRAGDSWNAISSNYLMSTGAATETDGTSILVGRVGLAVIEGLEVSEYQGGY
ncbi:hypothetical protein ACFYZH_09950 [Streptomyces abikoensis]|uniref:hypothetical protein n=1 Tax=Streptomyces abikoensis TaxID=97398 RepID=UPI003698C36D